MKWVKEPPTGSGWYWARSCSHGMTDDPQIVEVLFGPDPCFPDIQIWPAVFCIGTAVAAEYTLGDFNLWSDEQIEEPSPRESE